MNSLRIIMFQNQIKPHNRCNTWQQEFLVSQQKQMKVKMAVCLSLYSPNIFICTCLSWKPEVLEPVSVSPGQAASLTQGWHKHTSSGIQIHTYRQNKVTNYLYSTYLDCENTSGYPEAMVLTTVPSCFFTPELQDKICNFPAGVFSSS